MNKDVAHGRNLVNRILFGPPETPAYGRTTSADQRDAEAAMTISEGVTSAKESTMLTLLAFSPFTADQVVVGIRLTSGALPSIVAAAYLVSNL
jgi:hypothetical protein